MGKTQDTQVANIVAPKLVQPKVVGTITLPTGKGKAAIVETPKKEKKPKEIVIENIAAPVLVAPVPVGKIELPVRKSHLPAGEVPTKAVVKEKIKQNVYPWRNFPIEHFEAVQELTWAACKALGAGTVTASRKAIIEGKQDDKQGTVFITIRPDEKFVKEFATPYNLLIAALYSNAHRCTKQQFIDMEFGSTFYIAMLNKKGFSLVTKCIKVYTTKKNAQTGISYVTAKNSTSEPMFLPFDSIEDNATFEGEDNFTGYVFGSNKIQSNSSTSLADALAKLPKKIGS